MARDIYAPARLDAIAIDEPFDQIQAADLIAWNGSLEHAGFRHLLRRVEGLVPLELAPLMRLLGAFRRRGAALASGLIAVLTLGALALLTSRGRGVVDELQSVALRQERLATDLNRLATDLDRARASSYGRTRCMRRRGGRDFEHMRRSSRRRAIRKRPEEPSGRHESERAAPKVSVVSLTQTPTVPGATKQSALDSHTAAPHCSALTLPLPALGNVPEPATLVGLPPLACDGGLPARPRRLRRAGCARPGAGRHIANWSVSISAQPRSSRCV